MVQKEFTYKGKTVEQLQKLNPNEFAELIPSRLRRTIKRGFTEQEKILLGKLRKGQDNLKTHCREMVILPEMIGKTVNLYSGKSFEKVIIQPEMMGHVLGEFVLTRKRVGHNAPGVGATKSSSNVSVK